MKGLIGIVRGWEDDIGHLVVVYPKMNEKNKHNIQTHANEKLNIHSS